MQKLWLDDIRKAPSGWRHIYTVESMIQILNLSQDIEEVSLDNDLGNDETEGYKVLDWMEEQVVFSDYIPPKINIHSANPVAVARMISIRDQIQMRLDDKDVEKDIIGHFHYSKHYTICS